MADAICHFTATLCFRLRLSQGHVEFDSNIVSFAIGAQTNFSKNGVSDSNGTAKSSNVDPQALLKDPFTCNRPQIQAFGRNFTGETCNTGGASESDRDQSWKTPASGVSVLGLENSTI